MTIYAKTCCRLLLVALMLVGVGACAHEPFDPPETDGIPKGPGVFTRGDDGAVLFDSKRQKSGGNTGPPTAPAVENPGEAPMSDEDYKEFEAYRQWLEWKKNNVGTDEYKSFKQWQEWRRYQEWKKK